MSSKPSKSLPSSKERAIMAAKVAADNRGQNIVVLDMRGISSLFDFFVIATGSSRRQLHAISEEIDDLFEKDLGDHRMGISGYRESRWIVLDYGDILVHLFEAEKRDFYALEELWGRAERLEWENPSSAESADDAAK